MYCKCTAKQAEICSKECPKAAAAQSAMVHQPPRLSRTITYNNLLPDGEIVETPHFLAMNTKTLYREIFAVAGIEAGLPMCEHFFTGIMKTEIDKIVLKHTQVLKPRPMITGTWRD